MRAEPARRHPRAGRERTRLGQPGAARRASAARRCATDQGAKCFGADGRPAAAVGLRRVRTRRRRAGELLQRPSRRGEHHGDRLRPRRPRPLRLQAQRRRDARRLRHRRRPDARRRRERRHRQGRRRLLGRAHALHDDRRAELHRERGARHPPGRLAGRGREGRADGRHELPRLARQLHVALRADDRDGPAGPRPPHRRLEDVREQREVPLQGRHVRVVRRRAHVGGPGPPARLLRGARPVRPRQRGRLPHDLGPDDRLRRRGQRVRQRARRARRHERVQGLQHDRPHQAPGPAVDRPDRRARQPRQRADDASCSSTTRTGSRSTTTPTSTAAANAPHDGKIGTMYICWSFDGTGTVPLQQIVVMRSVDGGKTWGGLTPGDNIPFPVSQKTLISGIGCHVAIGPKGEVYITWYDNQLNALMQAKSNNRGRLWSLAVPIAGIAGVNEPFAGEAFRNLSIPSTAVDGQGNVYVVAASRNAPGHAAAGQPARRSAGRSRRARSPSRGCRTLLTTKKANNLAGVSYKAGGDGLGPMSGSDIVLFKSANGGRSYSRPVRVNQDPANGDADQFQPWIAVTPSGQVNVSFFDRRNDPANYFIDTWLARSEDGGRTFTDRRVSQRTWDPAVNAPTSRVGQVHRRLPGARRRRRGGDPVLERHAARGAAGGRPGALALPGGLRRARARGRRDAGRAHPLLRQLAAGRRALDRPPLAALDARPRRPPHRPAGAHRARRAALLRQGRRQRRDGVRRQGPRRARRDDRPRPPAPEDRPRQLGEGAHEAVRPAAAQRRRRRAARRRRLVKGRPVRGASRAR